MTAETAMIDDILARINDMREYAAIEPTVSSGFRQDLAEAFMRMTDPKWLAAKLRERADIADQRSDERGSPSSSYDAIRMRQAAELIESQAEELARLRKHGDSTGSP